MNDTSAESVTFVSRPSPERHIDRLLVIRRFFGLGEKESALRILDLGCGTGNTLLAQAQVYPEHSFLGIDNDEPALAAADQARLACGLQNVAFRNGDIATLDLKEKFDLILCHGVYSWLPPEVRLRLLPLISSLLAPKGAAYLSFNASPGWNARASVRDAVLALDQLAKPVKERIASARSALESLAHAQTTNEAEKREAEMLLRSEDGLILYELLNPFSSAEPLAHFAASAKTAGLEYLGDARSYQLCIGPQAAGAKDSLSAVAERSERLVRPFHCAVLCRADSNPRPQPLYSVLDSMFISSPFVHDHSAGDFEAAGKELFRSPTGAPLYLADEPAEFLHYLTQTWPRPTRGRVSRDDLAALFQAGVVDLHASTLGIADGISDSPLVTKFCRLQLSQGGMVTNLRHEYARLGSVERYFTQLLDGTRNRGELSSTLRDWIDTGTISAEGEIEEQDHGVLADQLLNELLEQARENALLLTNP